MAYEPRSAATASVYARMLSDLRPFAPPSCDMDDMDQLAKEVITAIRTVGSAQAAKAAVDHVVGAILPDEVMASLFEASRQLQDFVVARGTHEQPAAQLEVELETSSDEESETSSDSGDDGDVDVKRRRTETLAADGEADDEPQGPTLLSVHIVARNPHYLRDVRLQPLFPADTEPEREAKAAQIMRYLRQEQESRLTVQAQLTSFLQRFAHDYGDDEIEAEVDFLAVNRWSLVYGDLYAAAGDSLPKRDVVSAQMRRHAEKDGDVRTLYQITTGLEVAVVDFRRQHRELQLLDLDGLHRGGERGSAGQVFRPKLPQGTMKDDRAPTHEEIILPACKTYREDMLERDIQQSFPQWALSAFDLAKTARLNPMQSVVFPTAFETDDNMLVCAPTGAGKTLVALTTILRVMSRFVADPATGAFNTDEFKVVYIAPMKALVQEVVGAFRTRLSPLGVNVAELSGDSGLSRQQLAATQMIVATPEKWDIVTRKSIDLGVASFVRLIIVDEVHLLHNDRGPILESIIARTVLQMARTGRPVRLVGLSATLPNYLDVAKFLKVDQTKGLFNFDASYRPVPLRQTYCAIKRLPGRLPSEILNSVAYAKTRQFQGQSVMVFVHSRKDTEYTARYMLEQAKKEGILSMFVADQQVILNAIADAAGSEIRASLRELLPFGFGVHHAGMSKEERALVEKLYLDRHLRVLVSTSTLAWGVNLPAHAVVIKGTQIYQPDRGGKAPLSALDVLQMFGRAGRKGFDVSGEACIITTLEDVSYYLCILNRQLPIESHFAKHLVDALNAEVVLGNVTTVAEGAAWLQHTYHYVRLCADPKQYGSRRTADDPFYEQFRESLIHTAATVLEGCKMVEYDAASRAIRPTRLGTIASTYYIHYGSIDTYNRLLKDTSTEIDLFHLFALSSEFGQISVRMDERVELEELLKHCPVPVRDASTTSTTSAAKAVSGAAKVNVLLQCYITGVSLKGMALMTEMVYIKDSAQRIVRALYDICVCKDLAAAARRVLALYKMVLRQQWTTMCPMRQLLGRGRAAFGRAALKDLRVLVTDVERRKDLDYGLYRRYGRETLTEAVCGGDEGRADLFISTMRLIPRIIVEVTSHPLSATLVQLDVDIRIDVRYDPLVHDDMGNEMIVSLEDATLHTAGRQAHRRHHLLHHEVIDASFLVRSLVDPDGSDGGEVPSIQLKLVAKLPESACPVHYFLHVELSSWIGAHAVAPVTLLGMPLPPPPPPPTEPVDQEEPSLEAALGAELASVAEAIMPFDALSLPQADVARALLAPTWENVVAGIPAGTGKTALAEVTVLRLLQENVAAAEASGSLFQLLYITCTPQQAQRRFDDWDAKFAEALQQSVVLLSGNTQRDIAAWRAAAAKEGATTTIVVASAAAVLPLIRRGHALLRGVRYVVADHLHQLGTVDGAVFEEAVSRLGTRPYITNAGTAPRVLGLTYPVLYPQALGGWLRAKRVFNFSNETMRRLQVRVEGCPVPGARSRLEHFRVLALKMLTGRAALQDNRTVVFMPAPQDAVGMARQLCAARRASGFVVRRDAESDAALLLRSLQDPLLAGFCEVGVAFVTPTVAAQDERIISVLLESRQAPMVVFATVADAWRFPAAVFDTAIVCAAERLHVGSTARDELSTQPFSDASLVEMLQMATRADTECIVLCRQPQVGRWQELLSSPVPLASAATTAADFEGVVNSGITAGSIKDAAGAVAAIRSYYFFHHARVNPAFYGVDSSAQLAAALSEIADATLDGLREAGCILYDEDSGAVTSTNVGRAAAHHVIAIETVRALSEAAAVGEDPAEVLRLLCLCDELVAAPCARVRRDERGVLQQLARDAGIPVDFGLDFSMPDTKAYVLVRVVLGRHRIDLAACIRQYVPSSEEAALLSTQLQADAAELFERAVRVAEAAVDIVGRRSFTAARAMMQLLALLLAETWPQDGADVTAVATLPERVLPAAAVRAIGPEAAAQCGGLAPTDAAQALQRVQQQALVEAEGISEEAAAARAADQVAEVVAYCKSVRAVHAQSPAAVQLTATARIVMVNGALHLQVDASFDPLSSQADLAAAWVVCFNASSPEGPLYGLRPVHAPTAGGRLSTTLLMALPEAAEDADVALRLAVVPMRLPCPLAPTIEVDVEIVEDELS